MCRRSTVSSSEPNWPEESSRPHAPDDQGWYTLGGDGWSTSDDQGWYTSGDHARYTSGDCAWSSLGRSMTDGSEPRSNPAQRLTGTFCVDAVEVIYDAAHSIDEMLLPHLRSVNYDPSPFPVRSIHSKC